MNNRAIEPQGLEGTSRDHQIQSLLTRSDHLGILSMPYDSTQDDLSHNIPWHLNQIDKPVVS